jgi:CRP/FNR family transcriptional regulator, cyclic AMP receptor protein
MADEWARRRYGDGEVLFRQGDAADGAYVVKQGKVRIFRSGDGHETGLGVIGPGQMFGEMGLVDERPRSASAAAVGEVEVEFIGKNELRARVPDELIWTLLKDMGARLRSMDDAFQKLETEKSVKRDLTVSFSEHRAWFA